MEAKDTGRYSKLLYNLIGKKDDGDDALPAPAYGSVDASIFDEKRFAATPLSSSQKVVFVGQPKGSDDYISVIRSESANTIDEDGVYVAVSGNHACIQVDGDLPDKEAYWDFLEHANAHSLHFDDLLADLRTDEDIETEKPEADGNPVLGFAKTVGRMAALAVDDAGQAITLKQRAADIRAQRYQYAVKRFYREMLKSFVEA